jgi:hypothetical protein
MGGIFVTNESEHDILLVNDTPDDNVKKYILISDFCAICKKYKDSDNKGMFHSEFNTLIRTPL